MENKDLIERSIEVLRILDTGRTVKGENLISAIEMPTRDDVAMNKKLNRELTEKFKLEDPDWYEAYMAMRNNPTIRIMTQIVLTTALQDYYYFTDHNCSSKYRILQSVEKELPDLEYLSLLRLCHKNRFSQEEMKQEDFDRMTEEYQRTFLVRKRQGEK